MFIEPKTVVSASRPKKRMLALRAETEGPSARTIVEINSSSLEIIQTCKRKADYALNWNLISNEESAATLFGSAIHKGLEVWYLAPREARNSEETKKASLAAFNAVAQPLETLDFSDKRHPANGERILLAYFRKYADDPFEVVRDAEGGPYVERDFIFTLVDLPDLRIDYFGTVDVILRNPETGTTLVADHKTTSTLGVDFYNRVKPNHQYTGYLLGARHCFGIETDTFLVNGIQVAKTKADLARQLTTRSDEDFAEFTQAVEWNVREFLRCKSSRTWVINAPNPCCQWGGCSYREICSQPATLRESLINGLFKQR